MSFTLNVGGRAGEEESGRRPRQSISRPSVPLALAVIALVAAILMLGTVVLDAPIELSMFVAMITLMVVLAVRGFSFNTIQSAAYDAMRTVLELIIILITVGMLISAWAQSGTIPLIISLGLQTIHPSLFYVTAIILCSITSLITGTSWGTMGSVGVALMAVGSGLGMPAALTAGAIVCGSYFGDKLSMLSDSTNLAAAITGTPLLTHIKYMLITTVPAYIGTLLIYGVIGFVLPHQAGNTETIQQIIDGLNANFNMGWYSLIPAVVTVGMLFFRLPPYVAIFGGVVAAAFVSMVTQGANTSQVIETIHSGFVLDTGLTNLDDLVSGGGALSMAGLVMLFLFAVGCSGLLNKGGFVTVLIEQFLAFANSRRKLMSLTSPIMIVSVGLGASLSFAAVMIGTLLRPAYKEMGLKSENLARTIEDSGTTYDAFYPWSGGGIFAAGVLGVATVEYMPFMFFAFLSTFFGIVVSLTQFKVRTIPPKDTDQDTTEDDPADPPQPDGAAPTGQSAEETDPDHREADEKSGDKTPGHRQATTDSTTGAVQRLPAIAGTPRANTRWITHN